jgi:hypothetical protein
MKKLKVNDLFSWMILLMTVCFVFAMISGCATLFEKKEKGPAWDGSVWTLKVCPTAKITTLDYSVKKSKFSGGPKLHVKVGVTNISDKPLRYRVSISLPDGASSGGFYPRKGKPPVIKPGEEKAREFPMYSDKKLDAITIQVDEL